MRRLDIGIASYQNHAKLQATVASVRQMSVTDWRLHIVDNASPDQALQAYLTELEQQDERIRVFGLPSNQGYAGAVRIIQEVAQTEYIATLITMFESEATAGMKRSAATWTASTKSAWCFRTAGAVRLTEGRTRDYVGRRVRVGDLADGSERSGLLR